MQFWYQIVKKDITKLKECLEYYQQEYDRLSSTLTISGSIKENLLKLPGLIDYQQACLSDINSILKLFEIKLDSQKSDVYKNLNETYTRALNETAKSQYMLNNETIVTLRHFINDIFNIKEKFVGLGKAYECMNFMLSNVVKLKVAGLDMLEL